MLTGIAIMVHGPGHDFAGAGIFVIVVLALIVVIFIRMYGGGNQPGRRSAARSRRRTAHRPGHPPARSQNHGHSQESHRRPHQH